MEIKHICLGKTRILKIDNQDVTTAILKEGVNTPVRITHQGLEGNEVAVHTDPVYALAAEAYPYWAAELGENLDNWPPGFFGENLLVSGLDETDLHLGDVLAVGDTVRLIVAGPRIPCFKLTWRLQQPKSFIPKFALSNRTGVYFGVLEEGTVKAGDKVTRIHTEAGNPTVSELAGFIFGQPLPEIDELRRILSLPSLSKMVALGLGTKLYRLIDADRRKSGRWSGWRPFRVARIVEEAKAVRSFRLEPQDDQPLAKPRAGEIFTVRVPLEDGGQVTRTWTVSDYQDAPDHYRITVLRIPEGKGSGALHDHIREGDTLELRAPAGRFVLDRSGFHPVVLVADGIGITPIFAMVKAHLERTSPPPLYLFYCAADQGSQPFRAELEALSAEHPNFKVIHLLSAPGPDDACDKEGYLTAPDMIAALQGCHIRQAGKRIDFHWFESDFYFCTPHSMFDVLSKALAAGGANASRMFHESFVPSATPVAATALTQAEVAFRSAGVTAHWTEEAETTLLELAEAQGLDVESGCRMGMCHACKCRVLAGEVRYVAHPSDPPEDGWTLPCIAVPASGEVVLDL